MQNIPKSDLIKIDHPYQKYHQHLWVKNYKKQSNNWKKTTKSLEETNIIKVKLFKYGTKNIAKEIVTIYDESSRTGKHPNEMNQGVLTVI